MANKGEYYAPDYIHVCMSLLLARILLDTCILYACLYYLHVENCILLAMYMHEVELLATNPLNVSFGFPFVIMRIEEFNLYVHAGMFGMHLTGL